jgi:ubiquinone/menaquinone biosynthesis C-methylase UbiE
MKRSYEQELMDDFSIHDERIDEALTELKIINKYLGGASTTYSALKYFISSEKEKLSILDIGSGSSDNLLSAKLKFNNLQIISLDKNLRTLQFAKESVKKINSDAFNIPFSDGSCDIVHTALFLHHFNEEQLAFLLKEFLRIAKIGIVINDLRRSILALIGIKLLTIVFSKSEFVKNDAPLSVKRGFTKQEILKLLTHLGAANFIIKKKWAFRWMIVIKK